MWNVGFWKFPDQVVRLAILFTVAVVVMIVVRSRFVPESFGQDGHYRSDAVTVVASLPIRYAGLEACAECHEEEAEAKEKSYHRTLSCEVCHDAAGAHAEDPVEHRPAIPRKRGACLYCHSYLPSRPTGFPQIIELLHNPVDSCTKCHDAHDPTPPHVPGACSACHAQIARTKAISHHSRLSCETCHETAPEHSQNPRAFVPKKPTEREFCGGCHDEKAKKPAGIDAAVPHVDLHTHGGRYLCWQCHYPHFPEAR